MIVDTKININWYPGHMAKAFRMIEKSSNLVDVFIELRDARIPLSSANPKINKLIKNKKRVIFLNKSDLVEKKKIKEWINYFKSLGYESLEVEAINSTKVQDIMKILRKFHREKLKFSLSKKIKSCFLRVMILGIPNVGKSTLINTLFKSKAAITGNKPGITRGKQIIKVSSNIELIDVPGLLWEKIQPIETAYKLAYIGSLKDETYDNNKLILSLLSLLCEKFPSKLKERYNIENFDFEQRQLENLLDLIGRKKGLFLLKGKTDINRTIDLLKNDFRSGKLGRLILDEIPEK